MATLSLAPRNREADTSTPSDLFVTLLSAFSLAPGKQLIFPVQREMPIDSFKPKVNRREVKRKKYKKKKKKNAAALGEAVYVPRDHHFL